MTRSHGAVRSANHAAREAYPPKHIIYMTNRGAKLGSALAEVIAAHGAPRRTENFGNVQAVAFAEYCSLFFFFDGSGRVQGITVLGTEQVDSTGQVKGRCRP